MVAISGFTRTFFTDDQLVKRKKEKEKTVISFLNDSVMRLGETISNANVSIVENNLNKNQKLTKTPLKIKI